VLQNMVGQLGKLRPIVNRPGRGLRATGAAVIKPNAASFFEQWCKYFVSNTEVGQDGILRAVGNRAERPINNRPAA